MSKITVSAARTLLTQNRDDTLPEVSDALFISWCNYINRRTYNMLSKQDPERIMLTSTLNLWVWTASYTLPTDFKTLNAYWCGVYETDSSWNLIDTAIATVSPWSRDFWYYVNSTSIVFTPTPTQTETLILRYIPKLTKLTSIVEETFIDEEYEEYLEDALVCLYTAWKRLPNEEATGDQRFLRAMDELLANYRNTSYTINLTSNDSSY